MNCLDGISIVRTGRIEELKQQDYHGKRVYIKIEDNYNNLLESKIDLGVHNHLDIEQEEYCFDIAFDEEGASLLINSNEQMFSEKLRSLLLFGSVSTRYKDIFDMYYLSKNINVDKLKKCMKSYIYDDEGMRENNIGGVRNRVKLALNNRMYLRRLSATDKKWIDESIEDIIDGFLSFLEKSELE